MPFEDRTLGDLLEEFYIDLAADAAQLRARLDELEPDAIQRLSEIEQMLMLDERNLAGLTSKESEEVWNTAHVTGDPLVDQWERELAAGHLPDLEKQAHG